MINPPSPSLPPFSPTQRWTEELSFVLSSPLTKISSFVEVLHQSSQGLRENLLFFLSFLLFSFLKVGLTTIFLGEAARVSAWIPFFPFFFSVFREIPCRYLYGLGRLRITIQSRFFSFLFSSQTQEERIVFLSLT